MIQNHFDKIFIINLERSIQRKYHIERQFKRLKIQNYEFFPAFDGNQLDILQMMRKNIVASCDFDKIPLSSGELGCAMSHIGVYEEIIKRNYKNALIIEDDVVVSDKIHKLVNLLMDQIPRTWDIIHFHSWVKIGCQQHGDLGRIKIAPNVYKGCDEWGGTTCYAITAKCAELLTTIGKPYRMTSDGLTSIPTAREFLGKIYSNDYFGFITDPFLVIDFTEHTEIKERGVTTIQPKQMPLI